MTNHMTSAVPNQPYYWYGWVWLEGTGMTYREGGGPYFSDYYGNEFPTQEAAQKESERSAAAFNAEVREGSMPRVMVPTWGVSFKGVVDVGNPPTLFDERWNREAGEWEWTLN